MSLVVTPSQLSQRAELYHQLNQLMAAGVPVIQALQTLQRNPPHSSWRRPLARVIDLLSQGATFSEALPSASGLISRFDIALLHAGEQSGRLPDTLSALGKYYEQRARLLRQALSALIYPVLLFHLAVFITPFPQFFLSGDLQAFLSQTFGVLLPIYLAVGILVYAAQGSHGELWRAFLEKVCAVVPVLGSARRSLALARLASSLEALLASGVSIIQAWEMAAAASGSPALKRLVLGWHSDLSEGKTPSEMVTESRAFPELFANLYHTGEISGRLDESLNRLQAHFEEEGSRKMELIAEWLPKLVYFAVMFMIAWQVISFWKAHFQQINDAINF